MPQPVRLGHIHKFALPFNQHRPGTRPPARDMSRPAAPEPEPNLVFSERRAQISDQINRACNRPARRLQAGESWREWR